jgi:hypothetical protein
VRINKAGTPLKVTVEAKAAASEPTVMKRTLLLGAAGV